MQRPNYTELANEFIDRHMCECTGAEVKVFIVVSRKTIGWHKICDAISYSQLKELTGLSTNAIKTGIAGCIKKGLIHQWSKNGIYFYDLAIEESVSENDISKTDIGVSKTDTPNVSISDTTKETRKEISSKENSAPKKQALLFLDLEQPKKRGRPPEKVEGYKEFVALWYQLHKGETGSEPLFLAADGNHIKRILKAQGLEIAGSKLRSYYGNSYWFTKDKNFSMGQFIHHYDEINIKAGSISKERLAALTKSMGK